MGFPRFKPTSLAWQVEFFHWATREGHDKPGQHILKSKDITLPTKVCTMSQSCYFSNSYVQIWELDRKEGWMPKNWCFWTVVLEKTLESPLDCKHIQPVYSEGDQPWIFIGRIDAPILWPPDAKRQLIRKDPDAGKNWRQEKKGDDRGWDGWMISLTQRTRVWATSRRWWRTGKPDVLQSTTELMNNSNVEWED